MVGAFRSHAKGLATKLILGLLIVSFAVWGIGDMLIPRPGQEEVARVGKIVISRLAVEKEMQRDIEQLRQRLGEKYDPKIVQMLKIPDQVVARMVSQELMRQESEALGIIPGDKMVAKVLRDDRMFHNKQGQFDKQQFLAILRQNGLSERDFVTMMREDMARRLISQAVSGNYPVQDITVKVMQAAKHEKRDVTIYTINQQSTPIADPSDKELAAYYQSTSSRYATPEFRQVSYVTIDEKNVANELNVSDEELKALYNERLEEYKQPETRDLQLLLYTGKEDAEKAKALLNEGKNSKQVAKMLPPVNATNTTMKAVTKDRLPEELQQIAFSLEKGKVSEPIASGFGYHVLKVDTIHAAGTATFNEVKKALSNELTSNRSTELLTQKANALEDLLAGGSTLTEAAKELGLPIRQAGPFSSQGKRPNGNPATIPDLKNFAKLTFSTDQGEGSAISLGKPGVYYVLNVDKIQPEIVPPIAEVEKDLTKRWKASKRDTLEIQHAKDIAAKFADSNQRKEVITSKAVKQLATGKLSRTDLKLRSVELPTDMVQSIFAANVGDTTRISKLANGRYVIAIINDATLPPLVEASDNKEIQSLRGSIQTNQQQELMTQLMRHLYNKHGVVIHQEMLARIGTDER